MAELESYFICCVQRTGSWLLANSLRDCHWAGYPSDYFDPAERLAHCEAWGLDSDDSAGYVDEVRRRATTSNGVMGSKMMWNDFARFSAELARLNSDAGSDLEALNSAFGAPRFVWLKRRDKVRQGVSWWRADRTNQWVLGDADVPAEPELDLASMLPLVRFAQRCEDGWRRWFESQGLSPLEVYYEDLAQDRLGVVNQALAYLELDALSGEDLPPTRHRRQADAQTERYVAAVRAALSESELAKLAQ